MRLISSRQKVTIAGRISTTYTHIHAHTETDRQAGRPTGRHIFLILNLAVCNKRDFGDKGQVTDLELEDGTGF